MKKINFLLRTDSRSCPEVFKVSKIFTILCLIAVFGAFQLQANAQDSYDAASVVVVANDSEDGTAVQQRISGTVTNELGDPLPGATVQIEGTTLGAITDMEGKFSVEVPNQNAVVVVSFVGYVTQKVPVAGKTTINVSLEPTLESLQEVVVVGYGVQKKTTVTGSVSVVKGDEVAKVPVSNISNAMGGKLAGVLTRQDGGQPGQDNADIFVRGVATTGNSKPLIVVDGVIRDNINQIDPSIIESVSVLKDAAAVAPYGMGGANGVILITTKKGTEGLPTLSFNTYYGIQTPTYYPDLLNAVDYMKLRNEGVLNENPSLPLDQLDFDPEMIADYANLHADDPDLYPDSRTKDLVNFNIPIQKHDLQISGGSEKLKYFAGLGYFGQEGLFERVNYNRFNYNLNLETKVTNTTTVALSFLGSAETTNDLDDASSAGAIFRSGYKFIPTESIYYSNGLWGQFAGNSPVAVLNGDGYEKNERNTILTTVSVEQQLPFIQGLSVKGSFSYDTRMSYIKGWHTPFVYYAANLYATPRTFTPQISTQEGGAPAYTYLRQENQRSRNYTYQGIVNYARSFGEHDFTGLLVAEARNNNYDMLNARRNNFAIGIDEMGLGSSDKADFDNNGSSSVGAQIGYVYRVGWTFKDRYMLEASGRYDGHYYFAPGKKWGYFPAFSAGWRISEENFMQNADWINNLKLRASWGKSGNLAGSAYQYLSGYTLAGNGYAFAGKMVQEAYVNTENNPNITWEVSSKADIGVDAGFWRDLLTVVVDVFYEKRTGMLLSPAITVPYEYGLGLAQENAGKMDNYGFELSLGTNHEFASGLRVNATANVSMAYNKMVETFETAATYNNPNRRLTGRPYGTQFGYETDGLFTTADDKNSDGIIDAADGWDLVQWGVLHPGDIKYVDQNGDDKMTDDDQVVIGWPSNYPLMTFGFNPNASWKGFDLNLFFQGSAMMSNSIYNFQTSPFLNNNSNADYEYYNNRWTPDNQDAKYPRAYTNPPPNTNQTSDFWVKSTAYMRLKNATFGYTLPRTVLNKIKIDQIRVYVASQNLWTISNLKFMDPEMVSDTGYPNMKSFTLGANVTF